MADMAANADYTALALPEPKDVSLVEVRERVLPRVVAAREELSAADDIKGAGVLRRALEAYRKWVQDRKARDLIAAESRRTEMLIGRLLGRAPDPEASGTRGGRGRKGSPAGEPFAEGLLKDERHKFRLMYEHQAVVEALLVEGKVSRNLILDSIRRPMNGAAGNGCTVDDLHALAASGRRFGAIYADPPWCYANNATRGAAAANYKGTMSVEELALLPLRRLAADCCHLHLWVTNAFLFEAPKLFEAWGFRYQGTFVWCKERLGLGNCWRVSHEMLLLAIKGGPRRFADASLRSWLLADRGQHSAKPEQVRGFVERASPGPYLELFGRLAVKGWTVWGNQISRDLFTQSVPTGVEE